MSDDRVRVEEAYQIRGWGIDQDYWADIALAVREEEEAITTMLVGLLPDEVQVQLARGPLDGDGCRCCDVLQAMLQATGQTSWDDDPGRAGAALVNYHQGWDRKREDPSFVLGREEECYRRCLLIYRAAGYEEIPS